MNNWLEEMIGYQDSGHSNGYQVAFRTSLMPQDKECPHDTIHHCFFNHIHIWQALP